MISPPKTSEQIDHALDESPARQDNLSGMVQTKKGQTKITGEKTRNDLQR